MTYIPASTLQVQFGLYLTVTPGTITEYENILWSLEETIKTYAAGLSSSKFTVTSAKVQPH
jgi:hypothetical protein